MNIFELSEVLCNIDYQTMKVNKTQGCLFSFIIMYREDVQNKFYNTYFKPVTYPVGKLISIDFHIDDEHNDLIIRFYNDIGEISKRQLPLRYYILEFQRCIIAANNNTELRLCEY